MNKKICAFSTASDNYIPQAIVSLLSIRDKNDSIPLYILSTQLSDESKQLLGKHKINFFELNLNDDFSKTWEYPIECYYLFAGPELMYKEGFQFSLYIDGDVYCAKNPIQFPLESISAYAGVPMGKVKDILGDDYDKALSLWNKKGNDEYPRLQTGVLYFNNHFMHEIKFLNKIVSLYKSCLVYDIPRKGDDSLFALFQFINNKYEYKQLDASFNSIPEKVTFNDTTPIFVHFTKEYPKPWILDIENEYKPYNQYAQAWRQTSLLLDKNDRKRHFPNLTIRIAVKKFISRKIKALFD